jgi:hypothetical protein
MANCGESLEPMLGYCSKVIAELNSDDTHKLTEDLLAVLKDFRPLLKADKKSSPLLVELLDWDEVAKSSQRNKRAIAKNTPHHKS